MLRLEQEFRATQGVTGKASPSPRVWWALSTVPRDAFVPEDERGSAWYDMPIPIGQGQTISAPFLVALVADLLDLSPDDTVLEVGTGSGYQAAILSSLAMKVHTVEIAPDAAQVAAGRLLAQGHPNVEVHVGDGARGLPAEAPFDAIVVNGATAAIPLPLLQQLRPGGTMVVPVAAAGTHQQLLVVRKGNDGRVSYRSVLPVRFDKLIVPDAAPDAGAAATPAPTHS